MTSEFWSALVGALVGGLFTLAGALFAHWLTARHERKTALADREFATMIETSDWWRKAKGKFEDAVRKLAVADRTWLERAPWTSEERQERARLVQSTTAELIDSIPTGLETKIYQYSKAVSAAGFYDGMSVLYRLEKTAQDELSAAFWDRTLGRIEAQEDEQRSRYIRLMTASDEIESSIQRMWWIDEIHFDRKRTT